MSGRKLTEEEPSSSNKTVNFDVNIENSNTNENVYPALDASIENSAQFPSVYESPKDSQNVPNIFVSKTPGTSPTLSRSPLGSMENTNSPSTSICAYKRLSPSATPSIVVPRIAPASATPKPVDDRFPNSKKNNSSRHTRATSSIPSTSLTPKMKKSPAVAGACPRFKVAPLTISTLPNNELSKMSLNNSNTVPDDVSVSLKSFWPSLNVLEELQSVVQALVMNILEVGITIPPLVANPTHVHRTSSSAQHRTVNSLPVPTRYPNHNGTISKQRTGQTSRNDVHTDSSGHRLARSMVSESVSRPILSRSSRATQAISPRTALLFARLFDVHRQTTEHRELVKKLADFILYECRNLNLNSFNNMSDFSNLFQVLKEEFRRFFHTSEKFRFDVRRFPHLKEIIDLDEHVRKLVAHNHKFVSTLHYIMLLLRSAVYHDQVRESTQQLRQLEREMSRD